MRPRSRSRKTRRGVIGIESAIVMIAFVIVAAALAFVVLNMGFSTTQKAKTAISSSVTEASSALEIAGKVTGFGDIAHSQLNATVVPLKVAGGGDAVSLDPTLTDIKYYSNSVRYDNIFGVGCALGSSGNIINASGAVAIAKIGNACINHDPLTNLGDNQYPNSTKAMIYWDVNKNNNNILDQGEHANLIIVYKNGDQPKQLDNIKAEVIVPTGSALTVERQVPAITTTTVDLG
ncbi:archaellin/type IV pilin N-terminal domain-containing protein [Candidatus Nitrosotalea okcheonensis]|uniref:Flagellin n=1 Tax=Candidatus Nitrosotalea okcheonensis TaxID=1903276 RepID=A0A2H1FDW2_9ARCH|nr:archaellin/type IV pilin N-terminal domain-containing protein [Candidatus Nitrosotalea okcheonensis]SMH70849.1 Archaeal flagellin [Candidatus Nitrosotalea okcheonensis]